MSSNNSEVVRMLKSSLILLALFSSFLIYADCEVNESLKNANCSSEYFLPKNSKELNEYLQYGVFKEGKLLNLEIGHTLKDKEIVIGTTCDLRIKSNVDIQANLNGICLQANNIFINKHSKLLANKKAQISLIANNSITIRKSNIQTDGEVNISSKVFEPFSNEILISKDTKILAAAINMNTPSNLIINSGAKLKANDIVLNGGNCEVRENDDEDNDNESYQEKSEKKFKPKFIYSGLCLNNPISTNLKISSVVDSLDHLKLVYSIAGVSSDLTVKWKFDDEIEASENNISQTYAFPGRHLVEAVVKSNDGYFRKFGQYSNVSPTKYNNGQIAIFQFFGIRNMPNKLIGLINNSKFVLYKSENDSRKYIGEINSNIAGEKFLVVPEVGYRVTFKLNVMAEIVDPEQYIDNYIKKIRDSFEYIEAYNLDQSYLDGILIGLKTYITTLTANEKLILANTIQSNSKSFNSLVTKNNLILNRKYASYFFSLFVPSAYAQDSDSISDKNTHDKMLKMSIAVAAIISGVETISFGGSLIKNSDKKRVAQITGFGFIFVGLTEIVYGVYSVKDILKYIYSLDYKSIFGKFITELKSLTVSTFEIKSSFLPLSTATAYSDLYINTLKSKDKLNEIIKEYNSSVADINSALTMLRMPVNLISIDPITFPLNATIGKLSTDFINKDSIKILKSETGDVTLSDITKVDDKVSLKVHALKTQNIVIQFLYKNINLGIDQLVNLNSRVIVTPKAVINYTKTGLKVSFNSIDPDDPDVTGLSYIWNFGDNTGNKNISAKEIGHAYAEPGLYTVTLIVKDEFGNVVKTQKEIEVTQPVLSSQFLVNKSGMTASFTAANYFEKYSYVWDFGDNNVVESFGPSIVHNYANQGLYKVTLTVVAPNSTQVSTSKYMVASVGQIFEYSLSGLVANFRVYDEFNLSGTNLNFKWEFSDGTSAITKNLNTSHTFTDSQKINAGLKIISPDGKILYKTMLKKSFTYTYAGRKVDFVVDTSLFPAGQNLVYEWDFGDETHESTALPTISHSYVDLESRDVNLVVKDEFGNILNDYIDTIPDRTDSSLTYQQANRNIKFTLVSNIGGISTDFTYVWDFGDGKTIENNLDTVIHSYEKTGTFKTTVDVYDKNGKFLFTELTFILNDQFGSSFGGLPLSEITSAEYWESVFPLLSPTSISGFKYQYAFPGSGICYTNGISYFVQNGVTYVYLPFYNCTEFDNIFY